jgi:hypothetical protein
MALVTLEEMKTKQEQEQEQRNGSESLTERLEKLSSQELQELMNFVLAVNYLNRSSSLRSYLGGIGRHIFKAADLLRQERSDYVDRGPSRAGVHSESPKEDVVVLEGLEPRSR